MTSHAIVCKSNIESNVMKIKGVAEQLIADGVLESAEAMTHDELLEENKRMKLAIAEAMTNVQGWDRHKPFENPDMCGEMVSIRLSGLCNLAEIIQPGCRVIADARFLTGWEHPSDIERKRLEINKIARTALTEVHGETGWMERVRKLATILASMPDKKIEALSVLLESTNANVVD